MPSRDRDPRATATATPDNLQAEAAMLGRHHHRQRHLGEPASRSVADEVIALPLE